MNAEDRVFAWMRATAANADKEVLARMRTIQAGLLQDVDASIVRASHGQIAELKRGFKAMVDALNTLRRPPPEGL
jgi:hypothetical protein